MMEFGFKSSADCSLWSGQSKLPSFNTWTRWSCARVGEGNNNDGHFVFKSFPIVLYGEEDRFRESSLFSAQLEVTPWSVNELLCLICFHYEIARV
jgi:hypothetical protein